MPNINELPGCCRPDAQAFDEVRIVTVPRYKMSGLSGDEWRISASLQFWRNGELRLEKQYRNVESALAFASGDYREGIDDGHAYFATEGNFCDQEGCKQQATVYYRRLIKYCREGHKESDGEHRRQFCDEHKERGDCGLDDADRNYSVR